MKYQHTIKHNPFNGRWSCECGYTLGDGRAAFLAPCPAKKKQQAAKAKADRRKKKR